MSNLRAAVERMEPVGGMSDAEYTAWRIGVENVLAIIPEDAVLVTEAELAAVLSRGVTFDYGGRLQLALWWPDATDHPIVSAEMGYWFRAAAAILAKLREET